MIVKHHWVRCLLGLPLCLLLNYSQAQTNEASKDSTLKTYTAVEKEAYYKGGEKAWMGFLSENIDIRTAQKKAPAGKYTIQVEFIVGLDGGISGISPLTNNGYGMEEAVMKAIKKAPALWVPASIDGKKVKAYRRQPITLVIEEREKKRKD